MIVLGPGWRILSSNFEFLPRDLEWLERPGTTPDAQDAGPSLLLADHLVADVQLEIWAGAEDYEVCLTLKASSRDSHEVVRHRCSAFGPAMAAAQDLSVRFWEREGLTLLADIDVST